MSQPPAAPASSSELEALLYAGAYPLILERTAVGYGVEAAPLVASALAMSGRLDEAESVRVEAEASGMPLEGRARMGFFMVAGLCHAGQRVRAERAARALLPPRLRTAPALARFWIGQALALVRFFDGRFRRARRLGRFALAGALQAGLPYGRVLSLDLLAHVAVYLGEIHAGVRLLEQAEELARAVGLEDNARTLQAERQIFNARFVLEPLPVALARAEAWLSEPEVSYFTRRNGLLEVAILAAFRGEASRARAALEAARRIALPGSDQRARFRWLVAQALCLALSTGADAARPSAEHARALAGEERTLALELGFLEIVFLGERSTELVARYERLATESGSERALAAARLASGLAGPNFSACDDGLVRLLLRAQGTQSRAERADCVLTDGFHGLLPWAMGVRPGRRVIITNAEWVSEDQGEVQRRPRPHRPVERLLAELHRGPATQAELLARVWGIGQYSPSRHAAVIHTAVSRLRQAVGNPSWILTEESGYALAAGLEVHWFSDASEAPDSPRSPSLPVTPSAPPRPDEATRLRALIRESGPVSSGEAARALRISASSALRLLRRLAEDGVLERVGGGRSTRYGLRG